jgi:hypothetical protein
MNNVRQSKPHATRVGLSNLNAIESRPGLAVRVTPPAGDHSEPSRHLWAILKPPKFDKEYHIYLLSDSGVKRKQLTVTPAYESWQFERPMDVLNWLEEKSQDTPNPGGLR